MAIFDIKCYKSLNVSNGVNNGGNISNNRIVSGIMSNVFENITVKERNKGNTKYRKIFIAYKTTDDQTVPNIKVGLVTQSASDAKYTVKISNDIQDGDGNYIYDTQTNAASYTNWSGCGILTGNYSVDSTGIDVVYELDNIGVSAGKLLYISDSTMSEFNYCSNVSWNNNIASLVLQSALEHTYSGDGTNGAIVSSFEELGTLEATVTIDSTASLLGELDIDYISLSNNGCINDVWIIIFKNTTDFIVYGEETGNLYNIGSYSGTITNDYSPENSDETGDNNYYFKIKKEAWNGTFSIGDSFIITTNRATKGLWLKEYIGNGSNSFNNNNVYLRILGDFY